MHRHDADPKTLYVDTRPAPEMIKDPETDRQSEARAVAKLQRIREASNPREQGWGRFFR